MSERSRDHRASIIAGPSVVPPWRSRRPRRHPCVVHLETGGPRAEMRGVGVNEFRTPDREAPVRRRALEDISIEP